MALKNDNMFWRMTAQRLLVERADPDVLPSLYRLVNGSIVDALGLTPSALHALWTIDGLGAMASDPEAKNVVQGALYHPSAAVRKAAVQILSKVENTEEAFLKSKVLEDQDASVQLAALLYCSERPSSENFGKLLYTLSLDEKIMEDNWLSKALYAAAGKHGDSFMKHYSLDNPSVELSSENLIRREALDYDDSTWKTMELPQFIEDAGLQMDGVIWFRRDFNFNSSERTFISLGPIDDSDIVYINGKQIGLTEQDYARNRYYDIPKGLLKSSGNTIAIRVEDTGGGGGIYGKPEQLYIRSGENTFPLAGKWKYEIETDFAETENKAFGGASIAEVFAKNYLGQGAGLPSISETSDEKRRVVTIKTIKNEMKFDVTEFEVQVGQPIELVLENVDFMQHNLVIVKPGTKEIVGVAADKLATDPTAAELNYVPKMNEVLFATALVDPQQKVILRFTAPSEPGVYPFICTFPGHWRIMQGVMKVVANPV
jgi:azurin